MNISDPDKTKGLCWVILSKKSDNKQKKTLALNDLFLAVETLSMEETPKEYHTHILHLEVNTLLVLYKLSYLYSSWYIDTTG